MANSLPLPPLRVWTDKSGELRITASYDYDGRPTAGSEVTLVTANGESFSVAFAILSATDRAWIRDYIKYLNDEPVDEAREMMIKQYRAMYARQRRANNLMRQKARQENTIGAMQRFKARSILPGTR